MNQQLHSLKCNNLVICLKKYLDFIRPVCLPFMGDSNAMQNKATLKLTGWGLMEVDERRGTESKSYDNRYIGIVTVFYN